MLNFNKIPFTRLIIPLLLGIIIALYSQIPTAIILSINSLSFFFLVFLHYTPFYKQSRLNYFHGSILFVFFLSSGIFLSEIRTIKKVLIENELEQEYIAIIDQGLEEKEKSIKTVLKIERNLSSTSEKKSYQVLTYFQKDNHALKLKYGDRILIKSRIQLVKNAGNPNEFDYASYLSKKGIYYQTYLKTENYQILEQNKGLFIFSLAHKFRNNLLQIYKDSNISGAELAVLSALTLGYKSDLDRATKSAFSQSGAMHVLAVSGLHVGIILGILMMLFKPFEGNKRLKIIKLILIISSLWAFALLSGLSPSVRRAALMFSFVAIGNFINRQNSIYNSLLASASILLLFNPGNFFDVGFQLSYLAVLSIVALQPIIYRSIFASSWLGKQIWVLVSVSIAAQIGTTPIGLFYFNQFPSYFFITNIFVIPLAFIIIYLALSLLVLSKVVLLGSSLAYLLNLSLFSLNYIVTFIKNIPFSSIQLMEIKFFEVLLLYLFIILLFSYFFLKKKIYLNLSLLFLLIVSSTNAFGNYSKSTKNQIIVFNVNKSTLINFTTNTKNLVICDSLLQENPHFIDFAAKNFWTENNLPKPQIINFAKNTNDKKSKMNFIHVENSFILFKKKRIGILGYNNFAKISTQKKIKLDLVILSNNCKISLSEIQNYFIVPTIIIDSSNSFWKIKEWSDEGKNQKLDLYIIEKEGAFIWEIKD